MRIEIHYLSEIETRTGKVHDGWANGARYDLTRVETRRIAPLTVEVETPDGMPQIRTGWADRVDDGALPVFFAGGTGTPPEHIVAQIRAAWASDTRPDAVLARADYARLLGQVRERTARARQKSVEQTKAIAKKFRRAHVVLGDQSTPGTVSARSTRGTLLGYVNMWNGVWDGSVRRAS